MKQVYSLFVASIFSLLGLTANAIYVPVAVNGFNADVVADVQFNAMGSTTADVDGVNYVFISQSYNPTGTSYMPISNMVNSVVASTPGLTYQLAPYTSNNSLRLFGTSSGALTFNTPQSASEVFVLGATGSGTSTSTITITFTDLTTQVFPGQFFPDWFNGANFAIQGLGRALRTTNAITNDPLNPRLYQLKLDLLPANYGKSIQSVSFANTGAYLNVMAISLNTPPAPYDPSVASINAPVGTCFGPSNTITAQVCNSGSNAISLASNPIAITLKVVGPTGTNFYSVTMNTGILGPAGSLCQTAMFTGVNMNAGGLYSMNTTLLISGLPNFYLSNDSLGTAVTRFNSRPTPGPNYTMCQYGSIPLGQGLTVSGCATPIQDSFTINFTITGPCIDNQGSTGNGTSVGLPANCADLYACQFATGNLPPTPLPAGASFPTPAILTITNLATIGASFVNEVRMNLYGSAPLGAALFSPGGAGGVGLTSTNFTYSRAISPTQVSSIIAGAGTGGNVNIGYWESFNDNFSASDISINAGGIPTTASLKIYYQYVPASFEWYNVPIGGTSLYSFSPFDPIGVPGSGLPNSNVAATTTFYAACVGSSTCRTPVNLIIQPTPLAFQDTISMCEIAVASNNAVFDLTTMDGPVSGFDPLANVSYYFDQPLLAGVPFPTNDTSSTNFIYTKVSYPTSGCYSSDSLLLQVNSLPEFPTPVLTGFTCVPGCINVASLMNPFGTTPPGTDTLFFSDPAYSIPHPNPYLICNTDTVYIMLATNTNPSCTDSAAAYIDVSPPSNLIAGQDPSGNFSIAGSYGCPVFSFTDGVTDTMRLTSDCKRIATITDELNTIHLGSTTVCEEISLSIPMHNGQPYLNRVYQITSANNDSANVCLYYLNQDFEDYNAVALINGWPLLPTAAQPFYAGNVAITKIINGDINTPGHLPSAIPNTSISISYDTVTTVWTICFPVNGFGYFYLHALNAMNAPLPVSLAQLKAEWQGNDALVSWTTTAEKENDYFLVERSSDAIHFQKISDKIVTKAIDGNSTMPLHYSFTDTHPIYGTSYYRLQQFDKQGSSANSQIILLKSDPTMAWHVYPNPVDQVLHVNMQSKVTTNASLQIIDPSGRVVYKEEKKLQEGNNNISISMPYLASGIYVLQVSTQQGLIWQTRIRKL